MNFDKVYVVTDNCVWDDNDYSKIVGIAITKELAKDCFKKYVDDLKKEIYVENLEISKDGIDDGYVIEEIEDSFSVYLNGEYNSYHVNVSIIEKKLIKSKESEIIDNYEF